jgi:phosphatidylglycerol---prolipoprotein diacylglyceryl transferase
LIPVIAWNIDREIFEIGSFALRWYSLLFAAGFVAGYYILTKIFEAEGKSPEVMDSYLMHMVLGTVIGARLGHCLFYEPAVYLSDPIRILKVWEGGLASHGGFLGIIIAVWIFSRKHKDISFFWMCDRTTIPAMLAAGFVRIGNFFNSEIIGRPAEVPWAVIFEKIDDIPRHPTQFYEAMGYLAISGLLYAVYRLSDRKVLEGRLFGLALSISFAYRFLMEPFKENQVAFEDTMSFNMGQLLSVPFVLVGFVFIFGLHQRLAMFQFGLSAGARRRKGNTHGDDEQGGELPQANSADGDKSTKKGELRKRKKQIAKK